MWCAQCKADVAAEVSVDNRRVHCATCHAELKTLQLSEASTKTQDARDILERWSNSRIFDPFGPTLREPPAAAPAPSRDGAVPTELIHLEHGSAGASPSHSHVQQDRSAGTSPSEAHRQRSGLKDPSKPELRFDRPPALDDETGLSLAELRKPFFQGARGPAETEAAPSPSTRPAPSAIQAAQTVPSDPTDSPRSTPRIDSPHAAAPLPPHFDVQIAVQSSPPRRTNWVALAGQLLAYGGVALLTVGTSLVLQGYFGGAAEYAPTGWLITTAGQMLLFLGVITLVSGGIEQTGEEVTRRVEMLGEQILRIEQASRGHGLRGPTIPAERFAQADANQPPPANTATAKPARSS